MYVCMLRMYVCTYVRMCVCVYVCMCVCVYVSMYTCVCIFVYVYLCMYTYYNARLRIIILEPTPNLGVGKSSTSLHIPTSIANIPMLKLGLQKGPFQKFRCWNCFKAFDSESIHRQKESFCERSVR